MQAARRQDGLEVIDRIALTLDGHPSLLAAAREHEPYIAGETLAVSVAYASREGVEPINIDGLELRVGVERAAR